MAGLGSERGIHRGEGQPGVPDSSKSNVEGQGAELRHLTLAAERGTKGVVASLAINHEELSAGNVNDALVVIDECFPLAADRAAARQTYSRYIAGDRRYYSSFSDTTVELVEYVLFRVDGIPAGVAGLYRIDGEPDRIYMGWLGVRPSYRKFQNGEGTAPLSTTIMDFSKARARELNMKELAAVAEDADSNFPTHRYYERHGFVVATRFERQGEADRLYVCSLS